jgi:hypothetical protein
VETITAANLSTEFLKAVLESDKQQNDGGGGKQRRKKRQTKAKAETAICERPPRRMARFFIPNKFFLS